MCRCDMYDLHKMGYTDLWVNATAYIIATSYQR